MPQMVMSMKHQCCICAQEIDESPVYTLTIRKEDCESEQEVFCHEACLEHVFADPKLLYLKYSDSK